MRQAWGWVMIIVLAGVGLAAAPPVLAGTGWGDSNTISVDTRGIGLLEPSGDCDGDGCRNADEYLAGTDPLDGRSRYGVAQWTVVSNANGTGVVCAVRWSATAGRLYRVERSVDLKQWNVVVDNVDPTPPLNTVSDEIVPKPAKVFYRIVVK